MQKGMGYIDKSKRLVFFILGLIGTALFAVGDILLQSFASEGENILMIMRSSVKNMPMSRLYFTLLTGIAAAPFMYLGLRAAECLLGDLGLQESKMYRGFHIASVIGSLSFFAAHSVCAVLMMSAKQAMVCGVSAEKLDTAFRTPFLVSFFATNLWVTVTELMLSAAFIYFVAKEKLPLPKWTVVMNTAGLYIIFNAVGALLGNVTGSEIFPLLGKGGASLGIGAMFTALAWADRRSSDS